MPIGQKDPLPVAIRFAAVASLAAALVHAAGGISGVVTNTGGDPLAGLWVDAYDPATNLVDSGYTDYAGGYAITNIPDGTYFVRTFTLSGSYLNAWYANAAVTDGSIPAGATPVAVSNATVTNVNFALSEGGAVSGLVAAAAGGALSNVWVDAYDAAGTRLRSALTDGAGGYRIEALPEGVCFVRTDAAGLNVADAWFSGVPAVGWGIAADATPVVVLSGGVTGGVNFTLVAGATLTGRVTDGALAPLSNIWVNLYRDGDWAASGLTASNGVYQIAKLPAGAVYARTDANGSNYADEWFTNVAALGAAMPANATALTLTAGVVRAGVDFALDAGASIAGTVTNESGAALAGAGVLVYDAAGTLAESAACATNGAYLIQGLPAGSYFVRTSASAWNQVDAWYANVTAVGVRRPDAAAAVALTSGAAVAGIDFGLATGGTVIGRVQDTNGAALAGVAVSLFDAGTNWLRRTTSDSNGDYAVKGLAAPGPVYAATESAPANYADSWYWSAPVLGVAIPTSALPVYLSAGVVASNVSFVLAPGGTVAGTVRDVRGNALASVGVELYAAAGGAWVASGQTGAAGGYAFDGLPAGAYYVRSAAAASNYVDRWYRDEAALGVAVPALAQAVTLTAGLAASNVDFALPFGGSMTGRVTDTHGTNLAGVIVSVFDGGANWRQSATTDSNGWYAVRGLATTDVYYVRTDARAANGVDEWFDDVPVSGGGIPPGAFAVPVATGGAASVGFALQRGGTIAGTLRDAAGNALSGIGVAVYRGDGTLAGTAVTDASGAFSVAPCAPGAYYVRTDASGTGFADAWYSGVVPDGTNIPAGAAAVAVAESATTNLGFQLGFTITSAGSVSNRFWLSWQAASGSAYRVEWLSAPVGGTWTNAYSGTGVVEQSYQIGYSQGPLTYRDASGVASNAIFYRVRVVP